MLIGIVAPLALTACQARFATERTNTTAPPTTAALNTSTSTTTVAPATTVTTTTSPTTTVAPTTATTAPSPATTTSAAATASPGQPSDAELIEIIDELQVRLVAMWANPGEADVLSYCVPTDHCAGFFQTNLDESAQKGERIVDWNPGRVEAILEVRDPATSTGGLIDPDELNLEPGFAYSITYRVVDDRDNLGRRVDANGETIEEREPPGSYPVQTNLIARSAPDDPELQWRVIG